MRTLILLLASTIGLLAQSSTVGILPTATDPTGAACTSKTAQMYYNYANGKYFGCQNGAYVVISGTAGGSPGGANTDVQFNDNGVFDGNSGFTYNKTAGSVAVDTTLLHTSQSNPAQLAVTPTCAGTCLTSYGYQVVVFNGVGWTAASTIRTVSNAATLDGSHFNTVTIPSITGLVTCTIGRNTGPDSPQILVRFHACDGSTFDDNSAGSTDNYTPTSFNSASGNLLADAMGVSNTGQWMNATGSVPGNGLGLNIIACCNDINFLDPYGNLLSLFGATSSGAFVLTNYSGTPLTMQISGFTLKMSTVADASVPNTIFPDSGTGNWTINNDGATPLGLTGGTGSTGKAVCWKDASKQQLGFCSTVVGATGGCTCN